MTRSIAVLFCGLACLWCHRAGLWAVGLTVSGYAWVASRYPRRAERLKEPCRPADAPRRRSIAWFPD
jgi:hypothetical protein